jgi:hypothetical protein
VQDLPRHVIPRFADNAFGALEIPVEKARFEQALVVAPVIGQTRQIT